MSTWDELNKAAGAPATKLSGSTKSSPAPSGWGALNAQAEKAMTPVKINTPVETKTAGVKTGLNAAGEKAFLSNPYSNAPLPKSEAPKTTPIKINEMPTVKINTNTANSTPAISETNVNPVSLIADLAKGIYNQYANPSESTIKAEQALGYTPTAKAKTGLEKVERVVSAPIRTIGKAFVRTFSPALEPMAETIGQVAATGEISDKVASGELPPEALDTLTALNKKWYQVVGDSTQAVLVAYTPSLLKDVFKNSILSGAVSGLEAGTTFGGAQVLSSGEKDPAKIAEILLKSAIAGSIFGTATGFLGGVSKRIGEDVNKKVQALDAIEIINQYADKPITKNSSLQDFKDAYYSAAKKTHPDAGGDPAVFSDVSQAYNYLIGKKTSFVKSSAETNQPVKGLLESETGKSSNALEIKKNLDKTNSKINEIVKSGQDISPAVIEELSAAKTNFNSFVETNKQPIISYEGTPGPSGESPKLNIDIVKIDDNQFSVAIEASYGQGKLLSSFDSSPSFKSQGEAILDAKSKILDWAENQPSISGASAIELQELVNQASSLNAKSEPVSKPMQTEVKSTQTSAKEKTNFEYPEPTPAEIKKYYDKYKEVLLAETKGGAEEAMKGSEIITQIVEDGNPQGKAVDISLALNQMAIEEKALIEAGPNHKIYKVGDNISFETTNGVKPGKIIELSDNGALATIEVDGDEYTVGIKNLIEAPKNQKAKVETAIKESPKTIKEIAAETKILEPNVRRILGVGAKEGTFERVDKGVYRLKKDGQDIAFIHPGDSVEILPRLAKEGFKADMIFLDIPYKTGAVTGGNRGAKFNFITVPEFKTVVESVKEITKSEKTPVFYMYSQAKSGLAQMAKYTDEMFKAGFKPVAKGEYTKLQKDGVTRTRNMRGEPDYPEGIILFTRSGEFDKGQPNLNFKMVRPKGYQTEKPAEMLNQIIKMSTDEGDVVLDPFAGSGVTGAEAVKEGRQAVLIEKSQKAIDENIKPRLEAAAKTRNVLPSTKNKYPKSVSPEQWTKGLSDKFGDTVKLYHQTDAANIPDILENGFKSGGEFGDDVFFTLEQKLDRVGGKGSDYLVVTVPKSSYDRLFPDERSMEGILTDKQLELDGDAKEELMRSYILNDKTSKGFDILMLADEIKPEWIKEEKPITKNTLTDFGEKIGGANKEAWAKRGLNISDLSQMNDREIAKYLKKDNIWLKNYDKLAAEGLPESVIMFNKVARDSLTPSIAYPYRDNTLELKQARNDQYINFIKEVKSAVEQIKTPEEIKGFYRRFVIDNGYAKEVPASYGPGTKLEYTDKQKANVFLTDKFRRAVSLNSDYDLARLTQEAKSQQFGVASENKLPTNIEIRFDGSKGDWIVAKRAGRYAQLLKTGLTSEVEAKLWVKENVSKIKTVTKKRFIPPQLSHIHRSGIDYRNNNTKNVTGEDYLKTFGFKGGEFGNWLNAQDRQTSLNFGYDALMDLSDALKISRQDVALGKTLSIAFGSRGRAGAAAHYEPDRKVFNLTKMNGAGSTAHEWFHALEDYLGADGKKLESFNDLKRSLVKNPDGTTTNYKLDSIKADGSFGKSGGYWQSQEEMLARAFASYITDKTGGKSDYLSGHSEAAVFPDAKGEIHSAFPQGAERKNINSAFDNFFTDLKDKEIFKPLETPVNNKTASYSIKDVSQFENTNRGVQAIDQMFDGEKLYKRLESSMKRLGLNFDIALFDKIYTGEMASKVVTDAKGFQTLKVIPEQAAGVVFNNRLALARTAMKFTDYHELIHIISDNMAEIPAFAKYNKIELLKEAQNVYGQKYLEKDFEEVLARGFEDFVYHRKNFTGKLKAFFSRLIYEVKQILNFTRRVNLKSFYEDVLYSKAKSITNLEVGPKRGVITRTNAGNTLDLSNGNRGSLFSKIKNEEGFIPEKYVEQKIAEAKQAGEVDLTRLEKIKRLGAEAKAKLVDFTAPIEDTLYRNLRENKMTLKPSQDIHNQIDRVLRTPTLAGQFVKDTGFDKVIREVDNIDNLDQYLIAKHAAELEKLGIETGRDLEKDAQLIEALKDKPAVSNIPAQIVGTKAKTTFNSSDYTYDKMAQKVVNYSHYILDYAVSAELISPEFRAKLIETYPDYVPFKRVFNEVEQNNMGGAGSKAVASLSRQSIVQKIEGSKRQIESPIGSLLSKTNDVFKQGEKNKAAKILISYKDLPGNPFEIKELIPEEVTIQQKSKKGKLFNKKVWKITGDTNNTISYLDKGIKRTFAINPDVARAAKALDVQKLNVLGQIFALPTRIARLGITSLNVPFTVSNVLKDQTTAFINSNNPVKTSIANPKVFFRAMLEIAKHGNLYEEITRAGGSGTSYDISRNQIAPTIKKIRAGRSIFSKIKYTVTRPAEMIRALEDIIGASEEFTRTKQYLGTKESLLKQGLSESEARIGAARAYNEDTVNFARRGEWGQVLNSTFLYLNAGIQGTRNLLRNLKSKPTGTAVKIALAALVPMAMATIANLKDEKTKKIYDDIPDWEKQNNMIIIPPNAKVDAHGKYNVIKIPISQEINNLTNFTRKSIEALYGASTVGFNDLASAIFGTVTPFNLNLRETASQLTPQALKPTIEGLANTDLYTGNNIVSKYMTSLPPEQQVYDDTSGTARKIGAVLGVSPLQVEHFLKNTFGEVSLQAENLSDKILNALGYIPSNQIGGRGIIEGTLRRFATASSGATNQAVKDELNVALGDVSGKLDKAKSDFKPTYDEIMSLYEEGNDAKAKEMIDGLSDADYTLYKALKKIDATKKSNQEKITIFPTYTKWKQLIEAGQDNEAQKVLDDMSDEEYKAFKSLRTSLDKKIESGASDAVETITPQDQAGFFSGISLYAKAIGTDPLTAFNRIFTGQKITKLVNGTIIVERMSLDESQAVKASRGGKNDEWKLDHTVPLELGGSNSGSNLELVPTSVWASYTAKENELGRKLAAGEITKQEAQAQIKEFKKNMPK